MRRGGNTEFADDEPDVAAAGDHTGAWLERRDDPTNLPALGGARERDDAAVEEMTALVQSRDRSPEAVARFSRMVIATLGLVRGHFGAEEHVVLDALDQLMTPGDFEREVIAPTERFVGEHGGTVGGH